MSGVCRKLNVVQRFGVLFLAFIIAFTGVIIPYQEVKAFFPLIASLPAVSKVLAATAVAAGVTYASSSDVRRAVSLIYSECVSRYQNFEDLLQVTSMIGVNGVYQLSKELFDMVRDVCQDLFSVGENQVYEPSVTSSYLGYPVYVVSTESIIDDVLLSHQNELYDEIYFNGNYYTYDYIDYKYWICVNGVPTYDVYGSSSYFGFGVFYIQDKQRLVLAFLKDAYWTDSYGIYGIIDLSTPISVTGNDVLSIPDYDFVADGRREVAFPPWSIETDEILDWLVGKTRTDVQNVAYDADGNLIGSGAIDEPQTILDWLTGEFMDVVGSISDVIGSIGQTLTGIYDLVGVKVQELADALSVPITAVLEKVGVIDTAITDAYTDAAVQDATVTDTFRNYNLPDLLFLFLRVLIVSINLLLRFLVFLFTLTAIVSDSSILHPLIVQSVTFMKNQTVPVFNVAFWTLFEGFLVFLFSVGIIKFIKRYVARS